MKINTKRIVLYLFAAGLAGLVGVALAVVVITSDLPDVSRLTEFDPPVTTSVWSRDGELIAELYEENRVFTAPSALPEHVKRSFLAAEDSKFYEHPGLDLMGIARAFIANVREGRVVQGGSTITQQVAKRLFLNPKRSIARKIREIFLAVKMEELLTKDEILRIYLNDIYMGHGAYGIGAAAKVYFGVSAAELTPAQAALLAGLPKAPSAFDPYRNPERALERRAYVIRRMLDMGWLTPEEAGEAESSPLVLSGYENPFATVAPYYSEHIRRELESRYTTAAMLEGGLNVVTTLDVRMQKAAQVALTQGIERVERRQGYKGPLRTLSDDDDSAFLEGELPQPGDLGEALILEVDKRGLTVLMGSVQFRVTAKSLEWAVEKGVALADIFTPGEVLPVRCLLNEKEQLVAELFPEPEVQGALVCIDAHTGEVLAAVGGYSFGRSQFNRAVQARRQAGSSIKPLIYAAAIEQGLTPAHLVYDSPIVYESADLEEKWKPNNYSNRFYGPTTLREALVKSRNVVTIKVLQEIGIAPAVSFLKKIGIKSHISPDLSLALGASSVSPMEMSSVYSSFATGGYRSEPVFFLSVTDKRGMDLDYFQPRADKEPSLDPRTAFVITNMMEGVIREGTGRKAQGLGVPAAGKTGTTNDTRDAWFIGFTPDLVAVVWIGYDEGASLGSKQTGGSVAAPIWKQFMARAIEGRERSDFPMPAGIEFARIDADTGKAVGPATKRAYTAAFLSGTAPKQEATERSPNSNTREEIDEEAVDYDIDDPGAMDLLR